VSQNDFRETFIFVMRDPWVPLVTSCFRYPRKIFSQRVTPAGFQQRPLVTTTTMASSFEA
jgi:hypothetical protein